MHWHRTGRRSAVGSRASHHASHHEVLGPGHPYRVSSLNSLQASLKLLGALLGAKDQQNGYIDRVKS